MKANEVKETLGVTNEDLKILRTANLLQAKKLNNGSYEYSAESVRKCIDNARTVRSILFSQKNTQPPKHVQSNIRENPDTALACHTKYGVAENISKMLGSERFECHKKNTPRRYSNSHC